MANSINGKRFKRVLDVYSLEQLDKLSREGKEKFFKTVGSIKFVGTGTVSNLYNYILTEYKKPEKKEEEKEEKTIKFFGGAAKLSMKDLEDMCAEEISKEELNLALVESIAEVFNSAQPEEIKFKWKDNTVAPKQTVAYYCDYPERTKLFIGDTELLEVFSKKVEGKCYHNDIISKNKVEYVTDPSQMLNLTLRSSDIVNVVVDKETGNEYIYNRRFPAKINSKRYVEVSFDMIETMYSNINIIMPGASNENLDSMLFRREVFCTSPIKEENKQFQKEEAIKSSETDYMQIEMLIHGASEMLKTSSNKREIIDYFLERVRESC